MSNDAARASAGATYRMMRELGSRSQHSFAALRETNELVVVQRFVRIAPAGSGGRNEDLDGAIPIDAEAMALLLRDARCLAKNWHPNVARVRHVELSSKPQSVLTVASDFIDGATLADLVAAGAPESEALALPILARILLDVLAGLHALHGLRDGMNAPLGAIHGELCPANVVVGRDGVARIVNVLRKRPFRVRYGSEAIGHAAPEALDATGTDDLRSDVYAVGVMLWEGLAGRKLTTEPAPGRILTRQRGGELSAPLVSAAGSPFAPLADVAMRALSFEPALRYRGAAEMAADIRKIVDARLASGASVATRVTELAGDRIRSRRAALEPAMSGTRKRATEHEIAAAEKTVRRRAVTIAEPITEPVGDRVTQPVIERLTQPAAEPVAEHVADAVVEIEVVATEPGIESAEHLIVAALSGATAKMRAVAIERAAATPAATVDVIPIEVTATWHESAAPGAPRARRRLLAVAVFAAAAVFAMALLLAWRTRATSPPASPPEISTPVAASTSLAPVTPLTGGDTSNAAADRASSSPPGTSAGRPPPRAGSPNVPGAAAKPKKSIYEPDGL